MANTLNLERAAPYENAAELRETNVHLLEALNRRLGQDTSAESEAAALMELESRIRTFLERGAATGALVEDIKERTACQVLLDYWVSSLSHAAVQVPRARLADFDAAQLPDLKDRPCPYPGLGTFREPTFFFGREKAVESLLERVATTPLVVVQGPAGSGKSSIVMGGALPVLRAADHVPRYRIVGPFAPGNAVLDHLVEAVMSVVPRANVDAQAEVAALRADPGHLVAMTGGAEAQAVLLVIDHFGEALTLSGETDRNVLAAGVAALLQARPDNRVIVTLREEFSDRLEDLIALRPYLTPPARFSMKEWRMDYEDLKAAVERPAALVNLQFQPGIVDDMVKSVLGSPDTALPLLQFALRLLWEKRDRNRITWEIYTAIGGSPQAALEKFADGFYKGLRSDEERDEVERILLELVRIDRMLEPLRQPVLRRQLLKLGTERTGDLLALLERSGFVHITPAPDGSDAVVEVTHEALLRNWQRYKDWIGAKRERVRQRIALTETAQRWERRGKSLNRDLLTGWQLQEVRGLPDLSDVEKEYVQVSQTAIEREDKRKHRRNVLVTLIATLAVVGVAWMYWEQQQARQSKLRQDLLLMMTAAKEASLSGKLDHALTQALRATSSQQEFGRGHEGGTLWYEARTMMLSILRESGDLRRLFVKADTVFQAVAFHPTSSDALMAFGGSDGNIYLAGIDKPFAATLRTCGSGGVTALAFGPEGRWLGAGCADGTVSVWSESAAKWEQRGTKQVFDRTIWAIASSSDGRFLAAGGYGNKVKLIALADDGSPRNGDPVEAAGETPRGFVWSLAFSPTEDVLLVGDGVGRVLSCSAAAEASWRCASLAAYRSDETDAIRTIGFSPEGARVAVGHWNGSVDVWDARLASGKTGKLLGKDLNPVDVSQMPGPVNSLVFFDNCGRRYLAIGKGTGLQYRAVGEAQGPRTPSRCIEMPFASIGDEVYSVAFHPPSGLLAAATHGAYVAVLEPTRSADGLRTVVEVDTKKGEQMRGAILSAEDGTARIVVPIAPDAPSRANLALLTVRDGMPSADAIVTLPVGEGEIRRVTAAGSRLLATLNLEPVPAVTVWRFDEAFQGVAQVRSLVTDDLKEMIPVRIALSPDGKWLAVSLSPKWRSKGPRKSASEAEQWCAQQTRPPQLLVIGVESGVQIPLHTALCSGFHDIEIAFSPDSRHFGAGGDPSERPATSLGRVQVWKVGDAKFERTDLDLTLSPLSNKVYEIAFAATARQEPRLAAGGEYGTIDVWDLAGDNGRRTQRVDSQPVWLLAFSSRGSVLAAADSKNMIRLWSLHQEEPEPLRLSSSTDVPGVPGFLAFGDNGKWLASGAWVGGDGGRLSLWDLDVVSLRRKACALLREPGIHGADAPVPAGSECDAIAERMTPGARVLSSGSVHATTAPHTPRP